MLSRASQALAVDQFSYFMAKSAQLTPCSEAQQFQLSFHGMSMWKKLLWIGVAALGHLGCRRARTLARRTNQRALDRDRRVLRIID